MSDLTGAGQPEWSKGTVHLTTRPRLRISVPVQLYGTMQNQLQYVTDWYLVPQQIYFSTGSRVPVPVWFWCSHLGFQCFARLFQVPCTCFNLGSRAVHIDYMCKLGTKTTVDCRSTAAVQLYGTAVLYLLQLYSCIYQLVQYRLQYRQIGCCNTHLPVVSTSRHMYTILDLQLQYCWYWYQLDSSQLDLSTGIDLARDPYQLVPSQVHVATSQLRYYVQWQYVQKFVWCRRWYSSGLF